LFNHNSCVVAGQLSGNSFFYRLRVNKRIADFIAALNFESRWD
jgi:hypothetical protein